MAIFKSTYTKPLPPGAEIFTRDGQRFARWIDRRGHKRTAPVTKPPEGTHAGLDRIVLECSTHTARYRDGRGIVRKVATGCRTKDAATNVLANLLSRAELVKAKVLTAAQDAAADHATKPTSEHIADYIAALQRTACPMHVATVRRQLERLAADCRFGFLPDLNAAALVRWLTAKERETLSARTRNTYLIAAKSFANWCVSDHRLIASPFGIIEREDDELDPRRKRRALTEDELRRLLIVARLRPLAEYGREAVKSTPDAGKRKRSNWTRGPLTFATLAEAETRARAALAKRPDFIAELERRGRERALVYKALVCTGLRKSELASLTVGQLHLDAERPYAELAAADEKNGQGADISLRDDLTADLRAFLAEKLADVQAAARMRIGAAIPMRLLADMRALNVPSGLVRILDRDLQAAGIAKRDERGYQVDVHAMRATFATHLSKRGVPLRTAQAAMRHSTPTLTAKHYLDPRLHDVAGAVASLPALPLDEKPQAEVTKATGTTDGALTTYQDIANRLVLPLVLDSGNQGKFVATADKMTVGAETVGTIAGALVSADSVSTKTPLTIAVSGGQLERAKGLEPSTASLEG